jgi:predicted dehydrogenase
MQLRVGHARISAHPWKRWVAGDYNAYAYSNVRLRGIGGGQRVDITTPGDDTGHFALEAEHFASCIRSGAEPRTPGEEGLKDMLAIEAIYKAAGTPIA